MRFVFYSAAWCPSCPAGHSRFEEAAARQGIEFTTKHLGDQVCEEDPIALTIFNLPTVVAIDEEGHEQSRLAGLHNTTDYQDFIRSMG